MYPILFKANTVTIYSFGLLVILGIIVGIVILWFLARKINLKLKGGKFFDYVIYVLLAGMIGSRLFYVIFHISDFRGNLLGIITSWSGGLSFYGGLIFGLLTAFLLLRKNPDRLRWLDIGFISTMFGLSIGMIGAFLNGSYYGRATSLSWAVTYTKIESFAGSVLNQSVHPTQIYEAIVALLIGIILTVFILNKRYKLFNGEALFLGIIAYAVWRIINDYFFLAQPEVIGVVRIDILISALLIIISIGSLIYLTRKNKNKAVAKKEK